MYYYYAIKKRQIPQNQIVRNLAENFDIFKNTTF